MKVPLLDLAATHAEPRQDVAAAIDRVIASSQFIGGYEVDAFEEEFARFTGAAHCVGVGNGLETLRLALLALGVGPGDEVVVPSRCRWSCAILAVGTTAGPRCLAHTRQL